MTKSTPGYMVKISAIAIICGVLAWRYIYFRHVLATQFIEISWVHAIGLYFLLTLVLLLATSIVCSAFNLTRETQIKGSLLILSVFIGLSAAELALRKTGYLAMYSESRNDLYNSYFLPLQDSGWFHLLPPNHEMYLKGPEFKYYRKTNSLGYPDKEPTVEKQEGEIRLLTLGDSFTAGDGAPFDSSYPQLLVKMLAEQYPNRKISVINAGVFGSDPYFDFIALKENLLKYKPDVVLETMSTGDLFDIYYHGNLSRFKPGGKLQFNPAPWWEPLYAISRLSRVFFLKIGYDTSFSRASERHTIFEKEKVELKQLYSAYDKLAVQNSFKVIVLLRPDRTECERDSFFNTFEQMDQYPAGLRQIAVVDLLRYYHDVKGISSQQFKQYFWPIDGHHNSKGYHLMAQGAYGPVVQAIDSLAGAEDQ